MDPLTEVRGQGEQLETQRRVVWMWFGAFPGAFGLGRAQIQPVLSFLSVLHSPEHTKRFTELGREEKGEGGDRGDLVEKKESPKGERTDPAAMLGPEVGGPAYQSVGQGLTRRDPGSPPPALVRHQG